MLWLAIDAWMQSEINGSNWFNRGKFFTPLTAFYGGPYIVFFSVELDCKETYWLDKIIEMERHHTKEI